MSALSGPIIDAVVYPLDGYGRLLRPSGHQELVRLLSGIPAERRRLEMFVYKIIPRLKALPMVTTVGPYFGRRMRDDSYADVVLYCGVQVDEETFQVAVILHRGDEGNKSGLCFVERGNDMTPRCTVRFERFLAAFNEVVAEALPAED